MEKEEEEKIFDTKYIIRIIAAATITSLALAINDTTNVVGAMIISPLLDPLYIIIKSILAKNWKDLGKATLTEILGLVIAFMVSSIVCIILTIFTNSNCTNEETLLCWQTPMMFRLGSWAYLIIGFLYSFVCGIVYVLFSENNMMVTGVAIAIALVPPICNAGMMLIYGIFGNLININGGFTNEQQIDAFKTMGSSLIILFINIFTFILTGVLTLYIIKKRG